MALVVEPSRPPINHPATYGVGGDSPVVQFVSVIIDGSGEPAGVQNEDTAVSGHGLPFLPPQPVEMFEKPTTEKAPKVEVLPGKASAGQEVRLEDEPAREMLQIEPIPDIAAGGKHSGISAVTGEGSQGTRGSPDGVGSGTPGGGAGSFGKPAYLRNPLPPYPRVARERGWEGVTLLHVEVLDNGNSGKVEILKSSGHSILDESAVDTVRRWKFLPARSGNTPIPSLVEIPIRFQMPGH